jgi:hypothetical protein
VDDAGLGLVSHDAHLRVEQECERGYSSSWPFSSRILASSGRRRQPLCPGVEVEDLRAAQTAQTLAKEVSLQNRSFA